MWHAFLFVFRCSRACCYRRCCFLRIGSLHCVFVFALMVRFVVFLRKGNYQRLVAWGLRNDRKAWRAGFACTGIGRARGSCFRASFRLSMTWSCPRITCMHASMRACTHRYIHICIADNVVIVVVACCVLFFAHFVLVCLRCLSICTRHGVGRPMALRGSHPFVVVFSGAVISSVWWPGDCKMTGRRGGRGLLAPALAGQEALAFALPSV